MADEEFDDVREMLHVCRGFEGGLRKSVKVGGDRVYQIGDEIVFVVKARVGGIQFVPHEDDDGEGFDRLHISRLALVTVVDEHAVAGELAAQQSRNAAADERRRAAVEARREQRKAERKAEREREKAGAIEGERPLFSESGEPVEPLDAEVDAEDLTDEERRLQQQFGEPLGV